MRLNFHWTVARFQIPKKIKKSDSNQNVSLINKYQIISNEKSVLDLEFGQLIRSGSRITESGHIIPSKIEYCRLQIQIRTRFDKRFYFFKLVKIFSGLGIKQGQLLFEIRAS